MWSGPTDCERLRRGGWAWESGEVVGGEEESMVTM